MKNNIIQPSILPGFMELLPKEQKIFKDILRKITKVYEKNGFLEMDTSIIEKSKVLLAKNVGETEKQVCRFNRGSNDLSLRFDLTVPFARFASQHFKEIGFLSKYKVEKSIEYLIIPIGDTLEFCSEVYRLLLGKEKYTEIYLEDDKLKKKLNYANKLGIPNVILIGEDEVLKREIKIKDMTSGEEKVINIEEIYKYEN